MENLLRALQPESLMDLAILSALYKPDTLKTAHVYIDVRRNGKAPGCGNPLLSEHCPETCGIPVFREQWVRIAASGVSTLYEGCDQGSAEGTCGPEREEHRLYGPSAGIPRAAVPKARAFSCALIGYRLAYLKCHYLRAFNEAWEAWRAEIH